MWVAAQVDGLLPGGTGRDVERPVERYRRLGISPRTLRIDQTVDDVTATGGDVRRICDLFGITVKATSAVRRPRPASSCGSEPPGTSRMSRPDRARTRGSMGGTRPSGPGTSASNTDCWSATGVSRRRMIIGSAVRKLATRVLQQSMTYATVTPAEEGRHRTFLLLGVGAVDGLDGAVSQGDLEGRHGTTVRPAGSELREGQTRGFWWHNRVRFGENRRSAVTHRMLHVLGIKALPAVAVAGLTSAGDQPTPAASANAFSCTSVPMAMRTCPGSITVSGGGLVLNRPDSPRMASTMAPVRSRR